MVSKEGCIVGLAREDMCRCVVISSLMAIPFNEAKVTQLRLEGSAGEKRQRR